MGRPARRPWFHLTPESRPARMWPACGWAGTSPQAPSLCEYPPQGCLPLRGDKVNIRGASCRAASACCNPGAAGGLVGGAGGSWPSAGGATYTILDRAGTGARAGEHRPGTRRSQRASLSARSIRSPPRGRRASARPKTCARNWRRQRRWPVGSRPPSGRGAGPSGLARQVLAELRVAPRERTGARRKAGGQGPIANEEPGAPALPLNPHDGNDGNGN